MHQPGRLTWVALSTRSPEPCERGGSGLLKVIADLHPNLSTLKENQRGNDSEISTFFCYLFWKAPRETEGWIL